VVRGDAALARSGSSAGFLLANIYSGSANTVWPVMAEEAERHNVVLFIFPGGRFSIPEKSEA
jgi:hypothetical protein